MKNEVDKIHYDLDLYTSNAYLTHNFHPYPAKFIPKIPLELIENLSNVGDWILDPFCGCGTTLVESNTHDRNSIGVDINPISVLVSKAKTTPLTENQMKIIRQTVKKIMSDIEQHRIYKIPEFFNIDHWFKKEVQEALSIIKHHIELVKDDASAVFLKVAFSSIIVKVSNQESDTRYAAVDNKVNYLDVANFFESKITNMLKRIIEYSEMAKTNKSIIFHKDSTNLDFIEQKIDLAITSPPYMNSYDYYLYHKHRMAWLDLDHKEVQEKEFGSRNKHNDKGLGQEAYTEPIKLNAIAVKKLLKKGGYYCVVVGDSILRKELIKMNKVFDEIFLEAGYKKAREIVFDQRKYTRTFTKNIKDVYKDSYILIYQKSE